MTYPEEEYIEDDSTGKSYAGDQDVNFKVDPSHIEPDTSSSKISSFFLKVLGFVIVAWLLTFTFQQSRINHLDVQLSETQQELQQIEAILNSEQEVLLNRFQEFEAMAQEYQSVCLQAENQFEECARFEGGDSN
ncbi:MAG: hypothetical protein AAF702_23115 [Chloroflexota bacterium]